MDFSFLGHFLRLCLEVVGGLGTAAVAVFAWQAYRLSVRQDRKELESAYGAVWVEYWRVVTIADRWAREDLIVLAKEGFLRPAQILPSDPTHLAVLLGRLGRQAARFGGTAMASAEDVEDHVQLLLRFVADDPAAAAGPEDERRRAAISLYEVNTRKEQETIRHLAQETASLFEDALKSAPDWLQHEPELRLEGLESQFAQTLRRELAQGSARGNGPAAQH